MVSKEAIDEALAAHGQWKKRLQDAVSTGQSDFDPNTVRKDNACQFGKWLYGLPLADTKSDDYATIKTLHAEFHAIAGEILALALAGQKQEAQKKLEFGGEYGNTSGKLALALQAWKAAL